MSHPAIEPLQLLLLVGVLALAGCAATPSPRVAGPPASVAAQMFAGEMQFYMPACADGGVACPRNVVFGIGEITLNTPNRFREFVQAFPAAYASTFGVALDSPGGNLLAGMQLGAIFREGGWNTVAGFVYTDKDMHPRTAVCASACSYAFLGGVNRFMFTDGTLGVHRFTGGVSVAATQETIVYVNLYLDRMGVSRTLQMLAGLHQRRQYHLADGQPGGGTACGVHDAGDGEGGSGGGTVVRRQTVGGDQ